MVRAQRNKLLSAFENLQGSGQYLSPSCAVNVAVAVAVDYNKVLVQPLTFCLITPAHTH